MDGEDGEDEWSFFTHLPPDVIMNVVTTYVQHVAAMNDTQPTPLERLTELVGSLAVLVRNVRMALQANGDDSECDLCMVVTKLLKGLSLVLDWQTMGEIANTLCVPIVMTELETVEQAAEICKITWLQGEALYDVLRQVKVLPRTHCIYYKSCPAPVNDDNSLDAGLPPSGSGGIIPSFPTQTKAHKRAATRGERSLENAIKIVQMSDIHMDLTYTEGRKTDCGLPVCCFGSMVPGPENAGHWGDYNCNPPLRTVELLMKKANELEPDIILYSGDTPSNIMWLETYDGQMNSTTALADAFTRNLPGVAVYPAIGNHDSFPGNQYYAAVDSVKAMNQLFIDKWKPVSQFTAENEATMRESGYYSKEVLPGLVVLSINNIYWLKGNFYAPLANTDVPASQNYVKVMQRFALDTMEAARTSGKKVIVMSHIVAGGGHWMHMKWLNNLIVEYSEIIVLHVGGHSHNDDFKIVRHPDTFEPKGVGLIVGSVSTKSLRNPQFRLFYLDPDTLEAMDYEQYFLDLEANYDAVDPQVVLSYRASDDYGLAAITPLEYDKLVTRMETDLDLFQRYVMNHNSKTPDVDENTCSGSCHGSRLCRLSHANSEHYRGCRDGLISTSPLGTTTTQSTLPPCGTTTPSLRKEEQEGEVRGHSRSIHTLSISLSMYLMLSALNQAVC